MIRRKQSPERPQATPQLRRVRRDVLQKRLDIMRKFVNQNSQTTTPDTNQPGTDASVNEMAQEEETMTQDEQAVIQDSIKRREELVRQAQEAAAEAQRRAQEFVAKAVEQANISLNEAAAASHRVFEDAMKQESQTETEMSNSVKNAENLLNQ